MAFDLVIAKTYMVKDSPIIFGSIEDEDYVAIIRLNKKTPNWFLNRMSNIFEDQHFEGSELIQAAELLDKLILETRGSNDYRTLLKLSAAVSMAIRKGHPLFGIAD